VKPVIAAVASTAREEELVARAKAGSSEAFEALFRRYRERITAYVRTIVPHHARAEDVVQEIFVSALRRLDTLEEPAAFRGWLYEIARNACVDDIRRVKRDGEIFIRSNDFAPYDLHPPRQAQSIHVTVAWKEELNHLKEALGGLPQSQHEALVLRELGGMSYDEIGSKMKLSRPAVESMLFRARRGLKTHFSEITTGARCRRMQAAMAEIAEGQGSLRDRRLLLRHIRDCTACRRQATAMGFSGVALPAESGRFRDAVSRVAALLPLPFLFNRRPEDSDQVTGSSSSIGVQAQGFVTQLSAVGNVSADHASSVIHKAAAVVAAVAVIGGGAGVAVKESGVKLPVLHVKSKHESQGSTRSRTRDRSSGQPNGAGGSSHVPADQDEGTKSSAAAIVGPEATSPSAAAAPADPPNSAATPVTDPGPEVAPTSDSPPADPVLPTDAPADPAISFDSSGSGAPADTTGTDTTGGPDHVTEPPADTGGAPPDTTFLLPPPEVPPIDTGGAASATVDSQSTVDPGTTP
jgi:RNA polymerase sigma factor (sigma-70 family)